MTKEIRALEKKVSQEDVDRQRLLSMEKSLKAVRLELDRAHGGWTWVNDDAAPMKPAQPIVEETTKNDAEEEDDSDEATGDIDATGTSSNGDEL